MDRPPYCFKLLITHFSVINVVDKLGSIEELTIEIESNGGKHSLVLIKPWPPLNRPSTRLIDISGLSAEDIDSVCAFKDSNITRIEITKKNKDIISIPCEDIKGLPNRTGGSSQTQEGN